MDKEIKEMLNELNNVLGDFIKDNLKELKELVGDKLENATKEKCIIEVTKDENGEAKIKFEGSNLAILITLAGLEKSILKTLNPPKELWEIIKNGVESEDVK